MDSVLKGGKPLPKMGDLNWEKPTASTTVSSATPLREAKLFFAKAEGSWQKRDWKSAPATIKDGRITAILPTDRPIAFFLGVVDDRGLEVTTTHKVLEK